jgi:(p)ppGpp synthase/HD superfamily hydrolase
MTNITLQAGRAWCVAMHGNQKFDGKPYSFHLDGVADILIEFGVATYKNKLAAYSHDVFEDVAHVTPVHMQSQRFPKNSIRWAWLLTDPSGKNRAERKRKLYLKLAGELEPLLIKLADRLFNWRYGQKEAMYHGEYPDFRKALYNRRHKRAAGLWAALDELYARGLKAEALKA